MFSFTQKLFKRSIEDMPRMTIEFPDKVDEILKELAKKGETSKVDVIRRALALYSYVNREVKEKDLKLTVVDDSNRVLKEIVLDI